jgi:hypothetical protein
MMASKILNPKRKCMELTHYRQLVKRIKGRRDTGITYNKRRTAQAIVRLDDHIQNLVMNGVEELIPPPRSILALDRQLSYSLSRDLGQTLGFNVYKKVISDKAPHSLLKHLFRQRIVTPDDLWHEIVGMYQLLLR